MTRCPSCQFISTDAVRACGIFRLGTYTAIRKRIVRSIQVDWCKSTCFTLIMPTEVANRALLEQLVFFTYSTQIIGCSGPGLCLCCREIFPYAIHRFVPSFEAYYAPDDVNRMPVPSQQWLKSALRKPVSASTDNWFALVSSVNKVLWDGMLPSALSP